LTRRTGVPAGAPPAPARPPSTRQVKRRAQAQCFAQPGTRLRTPLRRAGTNRSGEPVEDLALERQWGGPASSRRFAAARASGRRAPPRPIGRDPCQVFHQDDRGPVVLRRLRDASPMAKEPTRPGCLLRRGRAGPAWWRGVRWARCSHRAREGDALVERRARGREVAPGFAGPHPRERHLPV